MIPADNIAVPSGMASSTRRNMPQATTPDESVQRQLAWQREMERAQMAGWFKPGAEDTKETSGLARQAPRRRSEGSHEQQGERRGPAEGKKLPPAADGAVAVVPSLLQGSAWMPKGGEKMMGIAQSGTAAGFKNPVEPLGQNPDADLPVSPAAASSTNPIAPGQVPEPDLPASITAASFVKPIGLLASNSVVDLSASRTAASLMNPGGGLGNNSAADTPMPRTAASALVESPHVFAVGAAAESKSPLDTPMLERSGPRAVRASAPEGTSSESEAMNAAAVLKLTAEFSPAPLRLHEETRLGGQAVWIAMRADDQTLVSILPRLVSDLERGMRERGKRLHQVVCNGRLVWRDGVAMPSGSHSNTFDSFDPKEA